MYISSGGRADLFSLRFLTFAEIAKKAVGKWFGCFIGIDVVLWRISVRLLSPTNEIRFIFGLWVKELKHSQSKHSAISSGFKKGRDCKIFTN